MINETKSLQIELGAPMATEVLGAGVNNAIGGLSQMVGRKIEVKHLELREIAARSIPDLFGGPEALIVAVYLAISGHASGHMMVIYTPDTAFDLVDLLMGQAPGSTHELTELEQSALGEVGNIMGSFFLNHLADATGMKFMPSPPAVMMDMAGAILGDVIASILTYSDRTYVVETTFGTSDRHVTGTFLIVSGQGSNRE